MCHLLTLHNTLMCDERMDRETEKRHIVRQTDREADDELQTKI